MNGIQIIKNSRLLHKAFKYIIENNKSNYAPYHNLNHLLTVLKYVDYIADGEEVYYDQMDALHLAALFHDFNHSAGKLSDDKNIVVAKKAFVDFAYLQNLEKDLIVEVCSLIDATQFPYTIANSNTTKSQKIIRDADMMQQFESNWISQTTLGLASENDVDIKKFIIGQRHFLESIIFLTDTANQFKKDNWKTIMKEFRILEVTLDLC